MKILAMLALLVNLFAPLSAEYITVASMAIGDDYQKLMYPTYINKLAYCQRHGYDFRFYTQSLDDSRPIPWTKIKIIQEIFVDWDNKWVFWTDADSYIMNKKIKAKDLIDGRYDMIVASDFNGINTGQFFIRNCAWSRDFLARIYAREEFIHHGWWEQMAIMDELANHAEDMKHVKVLPQRVLNSYASEHFGEDSVIAYHKGDFILHFAGVRGDELKRLIKKYDPIANPR